MRLINKELMFYQFYLPGILILSAGGLMRLDSWWYTSTNSQAVCRPFLHLAQIYEYYSICNFHCLPFIDSGDKVQPCVTVYFLCSIIRHCVSVDNECSPNCWRRYRRVLKMRATPASVSTHVSAHCFSAVSREWWMRMFPPPDSIFSLSAVVEDVLTQPSSWNNT